MRSLVAALDPGPRQRRRVLGVALIGMTMIGGLLVRAGGWLATPERDVPCADAGAAIDDDWNEARAADLRAAFTERAPALASSTAELVEPRLTEWATSWSEHRKDACAATRVRGEQSEQRLARPAPSLEPLSRTGGIVLDQNEVVVRPGLGMSGEAAPPGCVLGARERLFTGERRSVEVCDATGGHCA